MLETLHTFTIYADNFIACKIHILLEQVENNIICTQVPSFKSCDSAAWPVGKIVFTKIPMLPFGESMPPTILKPKDLKPGPLWKMIVVNDTDNDLGLGNRGSWVFFGRV